MATESVHVFGTLLLLTLSRGATAALACGGGSFQPGLEETYMRRWHVWADANGIQRNVRVIESVAGGGRGLVATRALARGEKAICVPLCLTLSVARDGGIDKAHWIARLALALAEEIALGDQSRHAEWIANLPEPPAVLMRWSESALAELQNSTLVAECEIRRKLRHEHWESVAGRRRQSASGKTAVDESAYYDAYDLVASRVLGASGESRLHLVPFVDMANHKTDTGRFEFTETSACLLSGEALAVGAEVKLDYGARPSDDFVLQYGFCPDRNPDDGATLRGEGGKSEQITWASAPSASDATRARAEAALQQMPTTLSMDLALQQGSEAPTDFAHATALQYRIVKKQLLSAVAGHAASSAATSAFANFDFGDDDDQK